MSSSVRPAATAEGARHPSGHRLSLVPATRDGAPRAPFVVLVGTLLISGLAGLLFLHTALAEDSFRLNDLKISSAVLTDREQALEQEVALAASPQQLAERAEALGMVRSVNPAFIRLADGRILGRPRPGVAPLPEPPAPTPDADRRDAKRRDANGRNANGRDANGRDAERPDASGGPAR